MEEGYTPHLEDAETLGEAVDFTLEDFLTLEGFAKINITFDGSRFPIMVSRRAVAAIMEHISLPPLWRELCQLIHLQDAAMVGKVEKDLQHLQVSLVSSELDEGTTTWQGGQTLGTLADTRLELRAGQSASTTSSQAMMPGSRRHRLSLGERPEQLLLHHHRQTAGTARYSR